MNTSVRARHDARGFSFVELLVTIVIAGIAFAALVPVFVSAQLKGAGDTARNQALNLTQDRIEKIRRLDYDLITEANLRSSSFQDGQFGTLVAVETGSGTKDFTVDYNVVLIGGTKDGVHAANYASGDGSESYKQVIVDVYWAGNPKPIKHAVLQTLVYKQYAGSFIDALAVSPIAGIDPSDITRQFITSYSITLTAYLNEADAQNTSLVNFWVYSSTGQELATLQRNSSEVTTPGIYSQSYAILAPLGLGSLDGTYTFKARAVSKYGYPGNTAECVYPVETGKPPEPTGLTVLVGDRLVVLSWTQSTANDVVSYQVYRDTNPGLAKKTLVATLPYDALQSPSYRNDTGLTNGTTYYYTVRAVDSVDNESDQSAETSAVPNVSLDTPPNPPSGVSATASLTTWPPQITLQWNPATTTLPLPTLDSAVDHYDIYRSDDNGVTYDAWLTPKSVTHVEGQLTRYSWSDSIGLTAAKIYFYRLVAVNKAGQQSSPFVDVSAKTRDAIKYDLRVENLNTKNSANIKVTDSSGNLIAAASPNPTTVDKLQNKFSANYVVWNLPAGAYLVWWKLTSSSAWAPSKDGSLTNANRTVRFGP